MNILILNWRDKEHPLAGGAEIATHEHAQRWAQAGHKVLLFSSAIKDKKTTTIIDGVTVIRRGNHYTVHLYAFFYYMKYLRSKIDLVIDEFHFIPFFTPLYMRKKIIAFIHETAEEVWFKNQFFPINIIGYLLEPVCFRLYTKIPFMTVSESTKKDLVKFGIPRRNIFVIHNGIYKFSVHTQKQTVPTIIYLGRLARDKGVEDAISSFYRIYTHFPHAQLWIVGKEEKKGYEKKLKEQVKNNKMQDAITFYQYVSEEKKFELLRQAWVLVQPSMKEGWGLTVIEAASQATPAVAYNTSGLRDSIVDNKTGLLAKEKKPQALADKILLLFKDEVLYNKLSKNAKEWAKQFAWKKATDESLAFIEGNI